MANPVLSQPDVFAPARTASGPGQPLGQSGWWQSGGGQQPYAPYPGPDPTGAQFGGWGHAPISDPMPVQPDQGRMTLDDVLTKTALTLGAVVLVAVATWKLLGDNWAALLPAAMICGLAAFIIPLVGAFRHNVGPAFALVFAVLEGVFLGAISGIFETYYPGIVFQAVIGTFVAAGCTLAAFHFGKFRLTGRMQKILLVSVLAYAGVVLINLILSFAGVNLGLFAGVTGQVGGLAWLFAGLGVVLAVFSLVQDFQYIEEGVRQGAPAKMGWTAAFGLSVTMVWLYINLLRILSYLRR